MRKTALISALLALLSSPAFAITCPAKGGPQWREYKSAHFLIDSDMSRFKVEALLKELETMRGLVLRGLFGQDVEVAGRIRVIALDSPGDFKDLVGNSNVGAYFKESWSGATMIVLPLDGLQVSGELVAHEVAHYLSKYQFPEQPEWFSEGLAEFLQTVAKREEQRQTEQWSHIVRGGSTLGGGVGLVPTGFNRALGENDQPVASRELLDWRGGESSGDPNRYHRSSWLLYHWLWNQRGKQFADYQKRLADGDDPAVAWKTVFPEYDPAKPSAFAALDLELVRYSKSARFAFYKVSSTPNLRYTDVPLSSAEVHLLLLQARDARPESAGSLIRSELDEAIAEDPQNPEALVERARIDEKEPDVSKLREIADARKGDARAWLALAQATRNDMERRLAYQKAAELNPENAQAQEGFAREMVADGRAKEALPFANRALDLEPWNPHMVETLALAAQGLGKCKEAVQLEVRAVRMLSQATQPPKDMSRRVAEVEKGCKPAAK
ncbi:MAG: tetratricopeptide repeat protein [Myxococcales bacterium]